MKLSENHSLKEFNTFGIDVTAKHFGVINTEKDLLSVPELLRNTPLPHLVLGGGSNVLFTKNFDGIVLLNRLQKIEVLKQDDINIWVRCHGGEVWHSFVMHCIENNWGGIENLSLIPGSVGAAPIQNIGAYGVELKDSFQECTAMHIETGEMETFDHARCEFGYRDSIFKREAKGKYIIAHVDFKLNKNPKINTSYGAIERELEKMEVKNPGVKEVSQAVINIRQSKLPDPKIIGNAGSFFKNPIIEKVKYHKLLEKFPQMPHYPIDEKYVKVPAGWLIDQAGWKGKNMGSYGVHDKQALVLINKGGTSGKDIYQLSEMILKDIESKYEIVLEREVNIL